MGARPRCGQAQHRPAAQRTSCGPLVTGSFDFGSSDEAVEHALAVSRWLRDWQWSEALVVRPGPLVVVTGI